MDNTEDNQPKVYATAVLATVEIPWSKYLTSGIPVKDGEGSVIGEVVGHHRDEQGRLIAEIELSSVAADGVFRAMCPVALNADDDEDFS